MAEILQTTHGDRRRHRGLSPAHIDMTPMVDLAFLLLTFFILTTRLLEQRAMALTMPVPGPAQPANNTLTLLVNGGRCFAYQGGFDPATTRLSLLDPVGLRNTLQHFSVMNRQAGTRPSCIVKAGEATRYGDVIDAMDEVQFAGIAATSIQDSLSSGERGLIAAFAH